MGVGHGGNILFHKYRKAAVVSVSYKILGDLAKMIRRANYWLADYLLHD